MTSFLNRSEAVEFTCGSSGPGTVSAQSKTSTEFWSTARAFADTLDEIFTFTSTCPDGMPGMLKLAHLGLRTSWKPSFGTTFLMMYGPQPGGGLFGMFLNGVPVGTSASDGNARMLSNAPYGATSLIVILPVESLTVMPEIVFALLAA